MSEERSQTARTAAELALVRVVLAYGTLPEFVVIGGLVPALLCLASPRTHAGTTDIDVQVNLEISVAAENAGRLESAMLQAGFLPTSTQIWRWTAPSGLRGRTVVNFELLADLDDQPAGSDVVFDGADRLGAVNLRGTGRAVQDVEVRTPTADEPGSPAGEVRTADVRVTGLAGFLLTKLAAAHSRRTQKDWYDIAFVAAQQFGRSRGSDRGGADTVRGGVGFTEVGPARLGRQLR